MTIDGRFRSAQSQSTVTNLGPDSYPLTTKTSKVAPMDAPQLGLSNGVTYAWIGCTNPELPKEEEGRLSGLGLDLRPDDT